MTSFRAQIFEKSLLLRQLVRVVDLSYSSEGAHEQPVTSISISVNLVRVRGRQRLRPKPMPIRVTSPVERVTPTSLEGETPTTRVRLTQPFIGHGEIG